MPSMQTRPGPFLLCTILALTLEPALLNAQVYVRESGPELFTYNELVQLNSPQELTPQLADKLHKITTTPFINNEAWESGVRPRSLDLPNLGHTLRVACWNIERGLELDDILLFLKNRDEWVAKITDERSHAQKEGK